MNEKRYFISSILLLKINKKINIFTFFIIFFTFIEFFFILWYIFIEDRNSILMMNNT